MSTWSNFDGLKVKFGLDRAENNPKGANAVQATKHARLDIDVVNGNHALADVSEWDNAIPAGSYITKATLVVTEAFVGGTSLTIGLATVAGVAIDADGIDAAIATAALAADMAVDCDGQLVATQDTIGGAAGVLYTSVVGTYTAGKAKLLVEFIG